VIFRLYRYKSQISSLLTMNKTTGSRFIRLFIMSSIVVVFLLPSSFYQLSFFLLSKMPPMHAYSWSFVHSDWDIIHKYPSLGLPVHWDRWMWISCGYIVFFCFGIGREARVMYHDWLHAVGFMRAFHALGKICQPSTRESVDSSAWYSTVGSKGKLLFNRKSLSTNTTMADSLYVLSLSLIRTYPMLTASQQRFS
jgi:pheromone a factor receptor